jgi:hypothetical protein
MDLNPQFEWEFNVLGIYNFRRPGPFSLFFDFLRGAEGAIPGDVVEFGVYRGRSLLSIALCLHEMGSSRGVVGFDSFSGFPDDAVAEVDDVRHFSQMAQRDQISADHARAVSRNLEMKALLGQKVDARSISLSGDFSTTSEAFVQVRAEMLGLDNVRLVKGPFSESLFRNNLPDVVAGAVFDCDLYGGYRLGLEAVWPRMPVGGMCFFDEYYSLKFPGPRVAVDEFLDGRSFEQRVVRDDYCEFERHAVIKTAL